MRAVTTVDVEDAIDGEDPIDESAHGRQIECCACRRSGEQPVDDHDVIIAETRGMFDHIPP